MLGEVLGKVVQDFVHQHKLLFRGAVFTRRKHHMFLQVVGEQLLRGRDVLCSSNVRGRVHKRSVVDEQVTARGQEQNR